MRERQTLNERIRAVEAAPSDHFATIFAASGLDKGSSFRFKELKHQNFEGCDLTGFDFTGTDLVGSSFRGARISTAVFWGADVKFSDMAKAADWSSALLKRLRLQVAADAGSMKKSILPPSHGSFMQSLVTSTGEICFWTSDGSLLFCDAMGDAVWTVKSHEGVVIGVIEIPDELLVSWGEDGLIAVHDFAGDEIAQFRGHVGAVTGVIVASDGRLVSWGKDNSVRIWESGRSVSTITHRPMQHIDTVIQLPNGNLLSTGAHKGYEWTSNGGLVRRYDSGIPEGLYPLPDGGQVLWGRGDLWISDGVDTRTLSSRYWRLFNVDGALVALRDGPWAVTPPAWARYLSHLTILEGEYGSVFDVIRGYDGSFVSWTYANAMISWSANGSLMWKIDLGRRAKKIVPIGQGLYVAVGEDATVTLLSQRGEKLRELGGLWHDAKALPDGKILLMGSRREARICSGRSAPDGG